MPTKAPPSPTVIETHDNQWCSTQEAAEILDVRRPHLTTLIRLGRIDAKKLSERVYLVDRKSVYRYLREGRQVNMGCPRKETREKASSGRRKS